MKAHKYWSVGALITMLGTFYTGYKKQKSRRDNKQWQTAAAADSRKGANIKWNL